MEKRIRKLTKNFSSEERKWLVVLAICLVSLLALIGFLVLLTGLLGLLPWNQDSSDDLYNLPSDSQYYIPSVNELPSGFVLVPDSSGKQEVETANLSVAAYTNPDHLSRMREVNVLYSVAYFYSRNDAMDFYQNAINLRLIDQTIFHDPFSLNEFAPVSELTLQYGHEKTTLGNLAIFYTMTFRYRNIVINTLVSAPVDFFSDSYSIELKKVLKKAVVYYASLVVQRLPIEPVKNVPQPPFRGGNQQPGLIEIEPTIQIYIEPTTPAHP